MKKSILKSQPSLTGMLLTRDQMKKVLGGTAGPLVICALALCQGIDDNGNDYDGLCNHACACVPNGTVSVNTPSTCTR